MLDIDETTTVRELLTACPSVFPILLRHGMCEECRDDPPPVSLLYFAAKHCEGDIDGLLEELRSSIGVDSAQ
ncbi:MAG: hypothetical protein ACE5HE_02780 [Phycisphaerae bacterium]